MLQGNLPRVFLDTDVAFDIISKRKPHFTDSIAILELMVKGHISIAISESCIANLIYLTNDIYKIEDGTSKLLDFVAACEVVRGGKKAIINALKSKFKDKEDAVQYFTAKEAEVDTLLTRNIKDFRFTDSQLKVLTPKEYMKNIPPTNY